MTSRICAAAVLASTLLIAFSDSWGQSVRFDAPGFIEGRDVSNAEFQSLHPRERLVEFALELSADFGIAGHENASAIAVKLQTVESDVTIVDYGPRTTLDSEVDGSITVENIDESSSSFGLQASTGSMPWSAGANAGMGGKNAQSVKFKKKPEQQLLISSGIRDRGTGLFIKFRKTSQRPLDGMHPIQLTLRVPGDWRTGFLRLECEAIARKESRLSETSYSSLGKRIFLIPLLIEGDEEARVRVRAIHQAESALRVAANSSIDRYKADNRWEEITRWAQPEKKSSPNAPWLERVTTSVSTSPTSVERDLTRAVSIALKDYSRQKLAFGNLRQPRLAEKSVSQGQPLSSLGQK